MHELLDSELDEEREASKVDVIRPNITTQGVSPHRDVVYIFRGLRFTG
jgi:hypothetical protein